jgi:hypothetical protein
MQNCTFSSPVSSRCFLPFVLLPKQLLTNITMPTIAHSHRIIALVKCIYGQIDEVHDYLLFYHAKGQK